MVSYEKISLISEKTYNKVWLANLKNSDTIVVVKEISNANTDVLNSVASIKNIHIPNILSCETNGDITTIVEEYISGMPLDSYIKDKQLSELEIISLISQVCDGIKTLHTQNPPIIHKDLKPSNILVSTDGTVKIIDFDAARKYNDTADTDTCHLGTSGFASPEHYGYSQTDARSDIYSIGAVMYELFSGRQFPKNSSELTLNADELCNSAHKSSKKLIHIIEKCTMFNPSARYQNIDELKHALTNYNNRTKKLVASCSVAALALCCLIGSLIISLKPNDKANGAKHIVANTPVSEPASDVDAAQTETPIKPENVSVSETADNDTKKNPVKKLAKATKITKNNTKKKKAKSIKPQKSAVPTISSAANPTNTVKSKKNADSNSKKNTTQNKTATNKKNTKSAPKATSTPKAASTPKLSNPVAVELSNKAVYHLDSYFADTQESVEFIIFYLKTNPSLTPVNVGCGLLDTYKLQNVYLEDISNGYTYLIPAKYWSLKDNHIVNISDKFLDALQTNHTYKIILDCDNAYITVKIRAIKELSKVTKPFNLFAISPACIDYSYKNPKNITLSLTNGYGRKVTKIKFNDSGKTLSSKYYSIDKTNSYITFKKSFFKEFGNNANIKLQIYYNTVSQIIDSNGYTLLTFNIKD